MANKGSIRKDLFLIDPLRSLSSALSLCGRPAGRALPKYKSTCTVPMVRTAAAWVAASSSVGSAVTELDTVLRSWDALYSATGTAPRPPAQLCSTPPAVDVSGPTPTQPDLVPVQQQEEEHDEAHNDHDSSNNVAASNFSSALASIPEEDAGSPLPTPPQDMLSAVLASIPEEEATEDDSPDAFGVSSGRALQLDAASDQGESSWG